MDPVFAADGTAIGDSNTADWGSTTTYDLAGVVTGHVSTSSWETYSYTYTYDANWTMLSYSSSDGITTTTYDSNWQVVSTSVDYSAMESAMDPVYAADGTTLTGYSYTDEWGTTKTYFVDATGELTGYTTSSSYTDSWSGTTYTYTDSYDATGMFTGYSYSDGTTTTMYDANGNMLSSTINQDIIAPEPLDAMLTTNGVTAFFGEDVVLPSGDVAVTLHQNGVTEMHITGITGDGTSTLEIATDVTLAAEDWVLVNYSATDGSNGISDTSGNVWLETDDFGYGGFVLGSEVSNTIDLSNSSIFSAVGGYDIVGRDGNDTIIGSAANDWIVGGMGADTMSGGSGADNFIFAPGESPALILDGEIGSYVDGAIVSFTGGSADIITDFGSGDTIEGFLANDQSLTIVSGSYNSQTGTFTVDRESGSDTMVISDTSDTGNTVDTGVVMMGVTESQLYSSSWVGYDSTNYAVSYYAVA
ncbi:MAG: hypothetical protein HYZ18_06245 [Pseudogulbenkiania sp.]|nr:hypothetical protein [Pseudogulbenkiania sp.]